MHKNYKSQSKEESFLKNTLKKNWRQRPTRV